MYNWNEVYNLVMDIKHKYIKCFNEEPKYEPYEVYDSNKSISTLEYMIQSLKSFKSLFSLIGETFDMEVAKGKIKYLQINQMNEFILLRYANYSSVFGGEEPVSLDDLFSCYDGFYRECRSIVIDLKREAIVTSPFKKFANLNEWEENSEENIRHEIENAKSVEITNKLDGSLQVARWYNNELFMTGSQSLDYKKSWRLESGRNMLLSNPSYVKMIRENPTITFMFEFISLADTHVVKYDKSQEGLYLIGMRDTTTGKQFSYADVQKVANRYNVLMTEIFDKTLDDVLKEIKYLKSDKCEGFVINIDGHMVKVKTDDYVKLHKIISKISSINLIIQNIADGKTDDLLAKIPKTYHGRVVKIIKITDEYIAKMEEKVNYYYYNSPARLDNSDVNKKEFMLYVDRNVPVKYRSYVRNKFLGKEYSYLKSSGKTPRYIKLNEMGVTDYKKFLEDYE